MTKSESSFRSFLWRCIASQVTTYMVCGMLFSTVFHYSELFVSEGLEGYMRPTSDPMIALGPAYQLIRGALFACILFPFRGFINSARHGWLLLWGLFVGLAILGVCGASPGSLEGVFYTQLPLGTHLLGLPEILLQTLAFSALLVYWDHHPKRALNITMIVLVGLILLLSVGGYCALLKN